jgi:hypothetical protein
MTTQRQIVFNVNSKERPTLATPHRLSTEQMPQRHYCLCLVKGIKIRPDPLPFRNDKRRDFCSRYDGYGDFCSGKLLGTSQQQLSIFRFEDINVDKSLASVPLLNKTLEDNPIYATPILVIAGLLSDCSLT